MIPRRTIESRASTLRDAFMARERLGWGPRITFEELVSQMVDAGLELPAAKHKV